jgi:hypothetical protein
LNLSSRTAGPWHLGDYINYITNDPVRDSSGRTEHPGLRLAYRKVPDGTWGELGPALLAYGPWNEGNPPAPGATLARVTPLLLYGKPVRGAAELGVSDQMRMRTFSEADEWSGGAWLTGGGKAAVILVGTKALGKTWYGFANGVVYPTSGDPNEKFP